MTRPLLEIAGLIRNAGAAFIERNRKWIRWRHVKVLLAIARCRTAALGGHLDECTRCAHRAPISYNSCRTVTARSVRRLLANGGLLLAAENFCPLATCTWSSPCRTT